MRFSEVVYLSLFKIKNLISFNSVFTVESPTKPPPKTTTVRPSTMSTQPPTVPTEVTSTRILEESKTSTMKTTTITQHTSSTQEPTKQIQEETASTTLAADGTELSTHLPPGTPIPNTSQNFTFK